MKAVVVEGRQTVGVSVSDYYRLQTTAYRLQTTDYRANREEEEEEEEEREIRACK